MDPNAVAPLLRCNACKAESFACEGPSFRCGSCGRTYRPNPAGYVDMIDAGNTARPPPPTMAQRLMESDLFVALYEHAMRPFFARVFAGPGAGVPTPADEFTVYERWLGFAQRQGPWLDLSCGAGYFTGRMAQAASNQLVVGLDLSDAMLEKAAQQLTGQSNTVLLRGDVKGLPFKDGAFEGINNAGSLHLYPDPDAAYREVFRLLKPGGVYVGSTFADSKRPLGRMGASLFGVRRTDLPALPSALSRAGFTDYEERRFGDAFIFKVRRPN